MCVSFYVISLFLVSFLVDIALDKIATIRRPKSEATSIDNTVTASAVTEEDCPLPDESCSFCKDHYQECYAASISKQQLLDWINKRIVTIQNKTDLSGQSANTSCSQCFTRYKKACMFSFIDEARHPEDEVSVDVLQSYVSETYYDWKEHSR